MLHFLSSFIIFVFISTVCSTNLESYNQKERIAIDKLRKNVENELYADYMREDYYLIRWIRDQNFDLNAAQNKLLKSLQWRKDNNVDNVFNDTEVRKFTNKNLPFSLVGRDEFGGPIMGWKTGPSWKIRKNLIAGNINKMTQSIAYFGETLCLDIRKIQKETGNNITQGYLIVDLFGYNLREHGCLACIPFFIEITQLYENHYVGMVKYLIAANAPRIFESLSQLVKSVIGPLTGKAFKVYSLADKEELKKLLRSTNPKFISREYAK